jgi:hypothetical protein
MSAKERKSPKSVVKEIRCNSRRNYSVEEKIRVFEGNSV